SHEVDVPARGRASAIRGNMPGDVAAGRPRRCAHHFSAPHDRPGNPKKLRQHPSADRPGRAGGDRGPGGQEGGRLSAPFRDGAPQNLALTGGRRAPRPSSAPLQFRSAFVSWFAGQHGTRTGTSPPSASPRREGPATGLAVNSSSPHHAIIDAAAPV